MRTNNKTEEGWTLIIRPKSKLISIDILEVWRYRDLISQFIRRNFAATYKQTVLGPLWFIVQPLLTTLMFTVMFGQVARLSTNGIPKVLFYLSGVTAWGYFSECLMTTSSTFISNANIFGKVYFPRLTVPIATVISNLIKFSIQFLVLIGFLVYFILHGQASVPGIAALLIPLLLVLMATLGLGAGIIVSALTTKYRDLRYLVQFGVQLLMYATPVIYPLSQMPEKYKWIMLINPMTPVIETFRSCLLGGAELHLASLLVSAGVAITTLFVGVIMFNRVEKTFTDNV